jgi:hypothetical protein
MSGTDPGMEIRNYCMKHSPIHKDILLDIATRVELQQKQVEALWSIIDDIDTYSDMAKADDKLYRSLVERRQKDRYNDTGISTDGYTLNYNLGGPDIKEVKDDS